MKCLSVMIKPSSSRCNLACKYCFYADTAAERKEGCKTQMCEGTATAIIKKAVDFVAGGAISFVFQGGEPLLAGLEFFEFFIEEVARTRKGQSNPPSVSFAVQTNGIDIDTKFCRFFAQHNFLLGVSLDGDKQSNGHRVDVCGENSFERILAATKMLDENKVEYNITCVLTRKNALQPKKLYEFFKQNGWKYIQFINCLKPKGIDYDENIFLDDTQFTAFLCEVFDLYIKDINEGNYHSLRYFDNLIMLAQGRHAEMCGLAGGCSAQMVVEGDGTLYPCDFYCDDEWALGNINEISFENAFLSDKYRHFNKLANEIKTKCKTCEVRFFCRGGCRRYEENTSQCAAFSKFLAYAAPILDKFRA